MKNEKLLYVVLILIVVVVGVSFGYFMVGINITGEGASTNVKMAKLLKVTYDAGEDANFTLSDVYPGRKGTKNFKVTVEPGSKQKTVIYAIKFNISENTFKKCTSSNHDDIKNDCDLNAEELKYTLKENGAIIASGDLTEQTGEIELAVRTQTVSEKEEFNYELELNFVDTGKAQNHNMGPDISLTGKIDVNFADGE